MIHRCVVWVEWNYMNDIYNICSIHQWLRIYTVLYNLLSILGWYENGCFSTSYTRPSDIEFV